MSRACALELSAGCAPTPREIERVAREVGPDLAAWAFTQWTLRAKAERKFPLGQDWYLERDGLEMASALPVAAWHASLFPAGLAVADIGCGLGADLIALARRGPAHGWEADPTRADYAAHNVKVAGVNATVTHGACEPGPCHEGLWMDPMRRGGHDLRPDPHLFIPHAETYAVKLSPLMPDAELQTFGAGIRFVSYEEGCLEAVVGSMLEGTAAYHVESGETLAQTPDPYTAPEPGTHIYELDPAAVRAHARGHWGLAQLGDHPGFLTGGPVAASPWLRAFRVIQAFNPKKSPGPVQAIKKRGPTPAPETLARKWGHDAKGPVALMWTTERRVLAVLAERAD